MVSKLAAYIAVISAAIALTVSLASAQTATTGTPRTQSYLLQNEFQNGQAAGSITPQDLRDLIVSAFPNALSLKNYGLPTGGDDTTAINNVLAAAKTAGLPVYAPAGIYKHLGEIVVDSVLLFGDGNSTIFESTSSTTSGATACNGGPCNTIELINTNPGLKNIRINTDWNGTRQDTGEAHCVFVNGSSSYGYTTTGFVVQNVEVHNCAGAGFLVDGASYGRIESSIDYNSQADAFHICCTAHDAVFTNNYAESPGDDCYPVVSTTGDPTQVNHIQFIGNRCHLGLARGMLVNGGHDIQYIGNVISGNAYACMLAAGQSGFLSITDITFIGNHCADGNGTPNNQAAALAFGQSGSPASKVRFIGNDINGQTTSGCFKIGTDATTTAYTTDILIMGNTCTSGSGETAAIGVDLYGATDVTISGNTISGPMNWGAIASEGNSAGRFVISGNTIDSIGPSSGDPWGIDIGESGLSGLTVRDNILRNGGTTLSGGFIRVNTTNAIVDGNWGDNTTYAVSAVTHGYVSNPQTGAYTNYNLATVNGGTTFTSSGCSATPQTGSATAGTYKSGTAGTCTVTITMGGFTAPHGWACSSFDQTTAADVQRQSASTTTTATIIGTTATNDIVVFGCQPY